MPWSFISSHWHGAGLSAVFGLLAHVREVSMACCSTFVSGFAAGRSLVRLHLRPRSLLRRQVTDQLCWISTNRKCGLADAGRMVAAILQ